MKIRKIITGIMTSAFLLNTVPFCSNTFCPITTAEALDYTVGIYGSLKYAQYSDYVKIYGFDESVTELEIPSEINGLPVTKIGEIAFYKKKHLKKVTVPSSVTEICDNAFNNCSGMETIIFEKRNSELKLGTRIFFGCTSLKNIEIPYGVTAIPFSMFNGCKNLTEIVIPESVEAIGSDAFVLCEKLRDIWIMNPECEIYDSRMTIANEKFWVNNSPSYVYAFLGTIHGYEGSTAQEYAENCRELNKHLQFYSIYHGSITSGYQFASMEDFDENIYGDINMDNKVNIYDLILMNNHILAQSSLTEKQCERADLIKDGSIDIFDMIELRKLVAQSNNISG